MHQKGLFDISVTEGNIGDVLDEFFDPRVFGIHDMPLIQDKFGALIDSCIYRKNQTLSSNTPHDTPQSFHHKIAKPNARKVDR